MGSSRVYTETILAAGQWVLLLTREGWICETTSNLVLTIP